MTLFDASLRHVTVTNDDAGDPDEVWDLLEDLHPAWHKDAACKEAQTTNPEAKDYANFFPERGHKGEHVNNALRVCRTCLVREECLEWSLNQSKVLVGVWGGLTGKQRNRERLRRGIRIQPPPRPIHHGTQSGYKRHIERHERPCVNCYRANLLANRSYRDARRAAGYCSSCAQAMHGRCYAGDCICECRAAS